MESRIKVFRIFVLISIFLDAALSIVIYCLVTNYIPGLRTDWSVWMLVSSLMFFLIAGALVFRLIKKYPAQPVSNTIEGLVFTFAIITFMLVLIDLFIIYVFADIAFDLRERKEYAVTPTLLFICVTSVIAIICAIFVAINSFWLLKIIRKNRWDLAQQIKNIGTDYE